MIKNLIQEAFLLKSKGYYKHAIEVFYKALELDNNSLELLLEIADAYYLLGETEHSIGYIERVLEKDPAHVFALKLLQKIFVNNEAWADAVKTAQSIFGITQKDEDLISVLSLLNRAGCYDEVVNFVSEKDMPSVFYEYAFAKFMLKDYSSALEYVNRALKDGVENDALMLLKGKILFKLNRKDECVEYLNKFKKDSKNPDECCFKGLVYQYLGEYNKALENFKIAIKAFPNHDEYYYNCASTYFKMGDMQSAKKYYNLAISLSPDNQTYHFALANLYYSERQYKRALGELNYDFFEARLLKAIILYDSGYFAIAKKELELLSKEAPNNHLISEYKSRIEQELKLN